MSRPVTSRQTLATIAAVLLGVLVGVGGFTFQYGEGLSYFSKDPAACMNCHIMEPQFASWQKSSHHTVATCVDCHLPHDFFAKYVAKAENGYNHSKAFTFQSFHEPITITDKNSRILERNCLECHQEIVDSLMLKTNRHHGEGMRCVRCHHSVGHGEMVGLGGPE